MRASLWSFAIAVPLFTALVQAQTLDERVRHMHYRSSLEYLLTLWDRGDLQFTKSDFETDFETALRARDARMEADPLLATILASNEPAVQQFDQLPAEVRATRPLSEGARLIIIGAFVDKIEQIEKKFGIPPTVDDLRLKLEFPLMIALGGADLAASRANKSITDAVSVQRSSLFLFSLGWPFCCAD